MNSKYGVTTCFAPISVNDPMMEGREVFRIRGPKFQQIKEKPVAEAAKLVRERKQEIMRSMKGLRRRWSCIEKAILVRKFIGFGIVSIGSMLIWNNERNGTYGYYYNPPYEFHAWLVLNDQPFIIDFALPGVIEMGLRTRDEYGAILKNMKPYILCGPAPEGLDYNTYEYYSGDELRQLAAKYSLDID